jgi:aspartate/tyrosine/aromatic aminotransferase
VERVYLTSDGRMSLAGLASKQVPYVAAAMKRVVVGV